VKGGLAKAVPALVGASAFMAPGITNALTKDELNSLSYLQVKGTGLANRCPEVRHREALCGGSGSGWEGPGRGVAGVCERIFACVGA
jgi:photosystem II oxygen-evolving enhancer protein 1